MNSLVNILELYSLFNAKFPHSLNEKLQEHQLRVAAVGLYLYENLKADAKEKINPDNLISSLLLHDMGNFAKFDLNKFPVENVPLEEQVLSQERFWSEFGKAASKATYKIAEKLGVSDEVNTLVHCVGFENAYKFYSSGDLSSLIAIYSDQRVGNKGVGDLNQRIIEGRRKYESKEGFTKKSWLSRKIDSFMHLMNFGALQYIENRIFQHTSIRPSDVTDENIAPYLEKVKHHEIALNTSYLSSN